MTNYKDIFERERDAQIAMQQSDSALAEAEKLTSDASVGYLLEEIRGVLDAVDAMICKRKNAAWIEIQKENKDEKEK